jgi:hypothetical protein
MLGLRHSLCLSAVLHVCSKSLKFLATPQNFNSKHAAASVTVLSVFLSLCYTFISVLNSTSSGLSLFDVNQLIFTISQHVSAVLLCQLLLSQLQSQMLCVNILFLVPCASKTRTQSVHMEGTVVSKL